MERIIVWGSTDCGHRVASMLQSMDDKKIVAIVDKNEERIGQLVYDIEIKSLDDMFKMLDNKEADSVIFAFRTEFFKDATAMLKDYDYIKGYIIPRWMLYFEKEYKWEQLVEIDLSKPRLKQFDVNLVDHCNMKCKGCLRFSNLVDEPVYADYDVMIKDWERMKELFWGVQRIKLMGGEPMLSPDLCKYIVEARRIFPDADIMVTTNAILINDKCTELFKVMNENHVYFDISLYEPMEKHISRVEDILKANGVWYVVNHTKGDFSKIICDKPLYDKDEAYRTCFASHCHHLREGRISVCSRPQYIHILNERYGTDIPNWDGVWNIYEEKDGWELDRKLSSSFEACKYCAPPVNYEWGRADSNTAKMEDWYV
ncbi:MAG: radical SAM protein [Lachnospiraceae bacterium]|nr:radical SAM protein [Lachnospiraceae bacterium]